MKSHRKKESLNLGYIMPCAFCGTGYTGLKVKMHIDWEKFIASIPSKTGVYIMKDAAGKTIYVGKALNLRSRVRSYFREGGDSRPAVQFMHKHLAGIDFILTDSEKEALILENNLIKEHRPKYNIRLRDDKDYLCMRLTTVEIYPRLIMLRRPKPTGEPTFGPYSNTPELKRTFRLLMKAFPLRTCSPSIFRSRKRPCLNYEMGKCLGPCTMNVPVAEYGAMINQIRMILGGQTGELIEELRAKMEEAGEELRFEDAARYRDRIRAVEVTVERQKMSRTGWPERDVIGMARKGDRIAAARMRLRDGKVVGVENYHFNAPGRGDAEALDEFMRRLYADAEDVPREIFVPLDFEGFGTIEEWLSEKAGAKVVIKGPKRGEGRALVSLAERNAQEAMEVEMIRAFDAEKILNQLAEKLGIPEPPRRIECIDISNISGKHAVGSLVRFTDAAPDKSHYRRYRIRELDEPDDYSMMRQVLERRVRRGIDENDLPDLIMVDGGKGQLNILRQVLRDLEAPEIAVASIAKDRDGKSGDRIFIPNRKNHVQLPPQSIHLLSHIRDEAHRFAIEYHRKLRDKGGIGSEITRIKGIGPSKRNALLKHFGSLTRIKDAPLEDLKQVKGISEKDSQAVYNFFHRGEKQ